MHAVKEKMFIKIKPVRENLHIANFYSSIFTFSSRSFGFLFAKGRPGDFSYRDLLTLFRQGEGLALRYQPNLSGRNLVTFCKIY